MTVRMCLTDPVKESKLTQLTTCCADGLFRELDMNIRRYTSLGVMLGILLGAQAAFCGDSAVGVVDMDYALRQFHKSKAAEREMERQKQEVVAEIELMRTRLLELEGLFRSARDETKLEGLGGEEIKKRLEIAEQRLMDVKEYEQRIQKFAREKKSDLVAHSERMRQALLGEIRDVVHAHAREKGLSVVLDSSVGMQRSSSGIVYREASTDITADVIRILNKGKDGTRKGGTP